MASLGLSTKKGLESIGIYSLTFYTGHTSTTNTSTSISLTEHTHLTKIIYNTTHSSFKTNDHAKYGYKRKKAMYIYIYIYIYLYIYIL